MIIKFKKLREDAMIPLYQTAGAAGMDLHAVCAGTLYCSVPSWGIVPTGLSVELPHGHMGLIMPRSGLALHGVTVLNAPGVIDEDYRGEIKVILINHGDRPWSWVKGDRIAQLVVVPVSRFPIHEAEELSGTERGEDGFGSTGV